MSDRSCERLGDYIDILTGFPFTSANYCDDASAIRLLRGDNVAQGYLRWESAKRWPPHLADKYAQYALETNDVILAMDRPWIEAGLKFASVRNTDLPCLLVQRVARLRARTPLDQGFLRYVIAGPGFTKHVLAVQTGTAVPHISPTQICDFRFQLPPLAEQRVIAEVLGALDDKIEANQRTSRIANQLFLAHCHRIAQTTGTGYRLGDIAHVVLGGTPARNNEMYWRDGTIPWINSGALHSDPVMQPSDYMTEAGLRESSAKLVPVRAALVAITGATLGTVSRLGIDAAINQSVVAIWTDQEALTDYIYFWLHGNIDVLMRSATGAAQQHVNKGNVEDLRLHIPDAVRSSGQLGQLLGLQIQLALERGRLVSLRAALLPKLLSGELRVRDAESLVGEAG